MKLKLTLYRNKAYPFIMQTTFTINTSRREELVDITPEVERIVSESKVKEGICHVFVPHATAGVTINENADPHVGLDILAYLSKNVPNGVWKHDAVDGNADAHIKASIIGNNVMVPINNGNLLLGSWQNIFLTEFDGPRNQRKIIVTVMSS